MNCPKCGWSNPDDAAKCANCFAELRAAGPPQPTQQMPQPPQQPYAQPPQQPYPQQPYAQQQYAPGTIPSIPDYLVWSIVMTIISLFCCPCLPVPVAFGIVAIVKSSQSNSKKMIGDYFGALQDANAAKTWLYWAAGLDVAGLIAWIIYLIFFVASFSQLMHHQPL